MSDWRTQAACRESPTDWFFTVDPRHPDHQRAKAICRSCVVRKECLAEALEEEREVYRRGIVGIRGGLDPYDRRELRGKRPWTNDWLAEQPREVREVRVVPLKVRT